MPLKLPLFFLLIYLFVTGFTTVTAQHAATDFLKRNILQPPMLVFEPDQDYDAATQNWSAHQLDDGRMLFTNSRGLLLYDGTGIQVLFDDLNLRDVTEGPDGDIYLAGSSFFGKMQTDVHGRWTYTDLTETLPPDAQTQTIWQAITFEESLYLRLRDGFVRVTGDTTSFTPFNPDENTWLSGGFSRVDGRLYAVLNQQDLYEIRDDELHFRHRLREERGPNVVLVEDPHRSDFEGRPGLLANIGDSFFSYHPHENRINSVDVSQGVLDALIDARPYKSLRMPNGYLAVATVGNGVMILDASYQPVLHLNTDSGLPSNTILNLFSDRENGLWLMTGNGLVRVDFNFPYWKSIRDQFFHGSIYQTIFKGDDLVITTSEAIYLVTENGVIQPENRVQPGSLNSTHHAWISLPEENRSELILDIGLSSLAVLDQQTLKAVESQILTQLRFNSLTVWPEYPHIMIAAGPRNVTFHEFGRGTDGELVITREGTLYEGEDVYRQAFFDVHGSLWFQSGAGGYIRLFSGEHSRTIFDDPSNNNVQIFDGSDEPLPLLQTHLAVGNQAWFALPGTPDYYVIRQFRPADEWYTADDFDRHTFSKTPESFSNPLFLGDDVYYHTEYSDGYFITRIHPDGRLEIPPVWNAYGSRYTNNQGGSVLDHHVLATSTHGVVAHMPELENWYPAPDQLTFKPLIHSIEIRQDSLFHAGAPHFSVDPPHFEFDRNQIRFTYSPGTLMFPGDEARYQSRLIPFDENWSEWSDRNDRTFTSLSPGDYRFEVRSKNNLGIISEPLHYEFAIATPFYRSGWAILLYITGLGLIILFSSRKLADYQNRRTREKMLAEQAEELEKINTLRSRMFTNIAHDLRTPITLMDAPVRNVLQKFSLPEEAEKYLNLSVRSAGRMTQLVDQIMDLNRLEAGRLTLFVKQLDIAAMLRMLAASFGSLAEHHNIAIVSEIPGQPAMIYGDADKLEKVIANLIDNAIKFSDEGGQIEISLHDREKSVIFSVKDSGAGIPEEKLPHIFDTYVSAGNEHPDYRQGMGIGLTITREYVQLHHGNITAESREGEYTLFTVTLPKGPEPFTDDQIIADDSPDTTADHHSTNKTKTDTAVKLSGEQQPEQPLAHILLVEDNRELADYVQSLLHNESYTVSKVENGQKALAWLEHHTPDLIISDVMMPVMDGMELLREIRRHDHLLRLPVIFLSAKTDLEGRMESFRLGVNDYIHKPFAPDELLVRIANLLEYSNNRKDAQIEYEESGEEGPGSDPSPDDEKLTKIRKLVESHITEGSFNLDAIASDVAMSKSTLYRYIKKETGLSAGNYVKEVRLQKAREYLEDGKAHTVKEVALAVGYSHSGYFSGQFYERFGKKITDYL